MANSVIASAERMQHRDERGGHEREHPEDAERERRGPPDVEEEHREQRQHTGESEHDRGNGERRRPSAAHTRWWRRGRQVEVLVVGTPQRSVRRVGFGVLGRLFRFAHASPRVGSTYPYSTAANDAAAFKDPTLPCIGSETRRSQCSRTSREMPNPSLPRTSATRPVGHVSS